MSRASAYARTRDGSNWNIQSLQSLESPAHTGKKRLTCRFTEGPNQGLKETERRRVPPRWLWPPIKGRAGQQL